MRSPKIFQEHSRCFDKCHEWLVRFLLVIWVAGQNQCLGQGFTKLNIKPERLQYAKEVEREAIKKGDSLLLAESWYLYGKTFAFAGDYRSSQSYFLRSLRILERRKDSFELSRLYVRLSENEAKQGHLRGALNYAETSLRIAERIQSQQGLMRAYGALGDVYERLLRLGVRGARRNHINPDTILYFYKRIEFLGLKAKDTLAVAEALLKSGTFLTANRDPLSVPYLKKALLLYTLKNKDVGQLNSMLRLVESYITLGQFKLAWRALSQAEAYYDGKKLNEYDIRVLLDGQFVRYFEKTGQWAKAYERLKKLSELERRQLLSDYDGSVTRLNIEYETEKKEALLNGQKKAIALNNQNLRLQQRFTIVASALFIMAAGMSVIFFRLSRKNQRISRRNEELVKEQNHRVKNNLQVISSLLSLQAKRLSDETAKKAIEESRLRVQSMAIIHQRLYDGDKLAKVNLVEYIQELVRGVLRAYGYSAVQTQLTIDDILLSADKAVPMGLILNELITNACKYAFPTTNTPELRINCHKRNNRISLTVADKGPGWPDIRLNRSNALATDWANRQQESVATEQIAAQKTSFGMQLIQSQVEQLYGTYRFYADGEDQGLVFTMEFNV